MKNTILLKRINGWIWFLLAAALMIPGFLVRNMGMIIAGALFLIFSELKEIEIIMLKKNEKENCIAKKRHTGR